MCVLWVAEIKYVCMYMVTKATERNKEEKYIVLFSVMINRKSTYNTIQ